MASPQHHPPTHDDVAPEKPEVSAILTTTVNEDLALAKRRLDDLARAVRGLRRTLGDSVDVRRLGEDVERARSSLDLVRAATAGSEPGTRAESDARSDTEPDPEPRAGSDPIEGRPALEVMSDLPYDPVLFADADDEGVGGMRPPRRTGR
jgi:hypothetical protein